MVNQTQSKKTPLIRYPRFNELHNDILLCQEATAQAGEPSCMVLEGVTGAGKSTLVKAYAENFPPYDNDEGTKIPVFYLETPSPVTVKGMALHMLAELGDPAADRGTLQVMNSRLIHYLSVCEVQLVILDDFHHLIDSETNRILATVSDWLKVLIKETGIPFLVVGIENSVDRILRANKQLSRLFAVREKLIPFSMATADDAHSFYLFLDYAQQAVKMQIEHTLSQDEFLVRMYFATDGVVANIMNLLRFAALLCAKKEKTSLTLQDLDVAFNKRLKEHLLKPPDPFMLDINLVLQGIQEGQSYLPNLSPGKRPKPKSAAQILRAK
ncbi:MAG: hypothetical protein CL608_06955 [Anaerolineaceae bacterium]|nr:hypothetical protein [Anaerolineaceae bacterium]